MFAFIVLLTFTSFIFAEKRDLVSSYSRLVVMTSDINYGVNYTPPTVAQIAASVTDANHSSMISSGLYTQSDVEAFRNRSYSYFLTQFGIDFSTGFVVPTAGTVIKGPFVNIPFTTVNRRSIGLVFDSDRIFAGTTGKWFTFQLGDVVLCQNTTIFSGGLHAGEVCNAGNALTYIDWHFIKTNGGDIEPGQQREVFIVQSPWVSINVLNSQGFTDSLSKLEIVDSNGDVGFFMENIVFIKDVVTGEHFSKMQILVTWA